MSKKTRARKTRPLWTPPIFGYQYRIYWESPEVCGTWNGLDWQPSCPYRIWVQGRGCKPGRINWSVYLKLAGIDHVRIVAYSSQSLEAAVRMLHRQVKTMTKSLQQLQLDEQKD